MSQVAATMGMTFQSPRGVQFATQQGLCDGFYAMFQSPYGVQPVAFSECLVWVALGFNHLAMSRLQREYAFTIHMMSIRFNHLCGERAATNDLSISEQATVVSITLR